jgi:hypothetical protein
VIQRRGMPTPASRGFLTRLVRRQPLPAALFAVASTPVLISSFDPRAYNHDISWLLYCSRQLLDGATAYVDFVETNPPLIIWLGLPTAWVVRLLGTPEIPTFVVSVLALVAVTLLIANRLLVGLWGRDAVELRHATLVILGAPLLLAPGYSFGQRDHLAVVLLLPYLLSAAASLAGRSPERRMRWLCGLWAAPALGLKPHLMVVWAAVEAVLWWSRREQAPWRRPENQAIAGLGCLYLLSIPLLAPAYLDVIRWNLEVYGAFAEPAPISRYLTVAYVGAGSFLLLRSSPPLLALRRIAFTALLGFVAVVVLQQRGFPYHFVPATVMGWISIGLSALAVLEDRVLYERLLRLPARAFTPLLVLLVVTVSAVSGWRAFDRGFVSRPPDVVTELARLVREIAPDGPIVCYSTRIYPGFPLVTITGAKWSSRFGDLWLIPGSYSEREKRMTPFPYHDYARMGPLEKFQVDAIVQDFAANPPEVVIFDRSRNKQGLGRTAFDFAEYLGRDPRFAALTRRYVPYADVGEFRVFRRIP